MQRISYKDVNPGVRHALLALEGHVRKSALDPKLLNLVYLRCSQINGCAFCTDMHDKDLRAAGEKPERLALLQIWREGPDYTPRERAALSYAEAITELEREGVPDAVFDTALREFGETQLVELTLAIATINVWNRMNIAFRTPAGSYQPATR